MDSFLETALSADGMTPSGGAAPFGNIFPEASRQREPKTLSGLTGSRYLENYPRNHSHRRVKSRCFGITFAFLSGMITVAAGAVAAWTAGVVFGIFAFGLICSGTGRVICTGASLAALVIDARRKGSLRKEWKTFFHCIAQTILRELPRKGITINDKLLDIGLQNNKHQRNVEICNFLGSGLAFGGGVTAAVAAVMTGGTASPVTAFAMIFYGVGGIASAVPRWVHLGIKGSLPDGVAEMCNFAEMERLHCLTCPNMEIGKNVTRLHKYYKIVKRVKLSGDVLGLVGAVVTVAAGAVEVSNRGVTAIIFGAGMTAFGSAGVFMHGASFAAWILLRRIKESFRKDWRDCFSCIVTARLRKLGKNSQEVCKKLRDVADKLDRHHQNVQTAKAVGNGVAILGGIVAAAGAAAGAVATVMTAGAAAPLVAAGIGAVACGAGKVVNKGASYVETVIEINTLEALQEEWNGFYTLFSQELEAVRKKSAMYSAELERHLTAIFSDLGSKLLNYALYKKGSNDNVEQLTGAQKKESAAKDGGGVNQRTDAAAELEKVISPIASNVSIEFVNLVNTAVQLNFKRKSHVTLFLQKLADNLEELGNRLCKDDKESN